MVCNLYISSSHMLARKQQNLIFSLLWSICPLLYIFFFLHHSPFFLFMSNCPSCTVFCYNIFLEFLYSILLFLGKHTHFPVQNKLLYYHENVTFSDKFAFFLFSLHSLTSSILPCLSENSGRSLSTKEWVSTLVWHGAVVFLFPLFTMRGMLQLLSNLAVRFISLAIYSAMPPQKR